MSLALHYWMGDVHHCSGPPVSEMTYTVLSGTLNSTIPYHLFWVLRVPCSVINVCCPWLFLIAGALCVVIGSSIVLLWCPFHLRLKHGSIHQWNHHHHNGAEGCLLSFRHDFCHHQKYHWWATVSSELSFMLYNAMCSRVCLTIELSPSMCFSTHAALFCEIWSSAISCKSWRLKCVYSDSVSVKLM